jgi:hypothetical protein
MNPIQKSWFFYLIYTLQNDFIIPIKDIDRRKEYRHQ